jgi:hypothetical protein
MLKKEEVKRYDLQSIGRGLRKELIFLFRQIIIKNKALLKNLILILHSFLWVAIKHIVLQTIHK